jgi:hypothetical protein
MGMLIRKEGDDHVSSAILYPTEAKKRINKICRHGSTVFM